MGTNTFQCRQCLNFLQVDDRLAGQSARCPTCDAVIIVPGSPPSISAEPVAVRIASQSKEKPPNSITNALKSSLIEIKQWFGLAHRPGQGRAYSTAKACENQVPVMAVQKPTMTKPEPMILCGDGRYRLGIVGESHYQRELLRICGGRTNEGVERLTDAVLSTEDNNRADRNAIRVTINGLTVGYLPRQDAFLYRDRIRLGSLPARPVQGKAKIRGGWDRGNGDIGHFGVWLDLDFRPSSERYPCPHCLKSLEPTPRRKIKCPQCQGLIVVRNSQPLTVEAAAQYDSLCGLE